MSDLPAVPEPHEMRASNSDRELVARILNNAMAEGRITVDELEERLDKVYAAKTVGELQPLTRDLPLTQAPPPVQAHAVALPDSRIGGRGTSSTAIAVMSGAERRGQWTVPPTFNAVAIMGGVEIDLTNARFEDQETTIQAFALMGGIEVIVPEDVIVRVSGVGFMGAFEDSVREGGPESGPVVKVTGFAMMGGVEVRRPKRKKEKKIKRPDDRPQLES